MRYSAAQMNLENGALIARVRWNRDVKEGDRAGLSFVYFVTEAERLPIPRTLLEKGFTGHLDLLPHFRKKNRADMHSIWLPSVEDLCAKDFYVLDLQKDWGSICGNFRKRLETTQTN